MYKKGFYINKEIGNNTFSFKERKSKKLWVPKLIEIDSFDEIKLQEDKGKIAFEDFGFDDELSTNYGLKNFYEILPSPHPSPLGEREQITAPIYLFDNHNHALYFWFLARDLNIIQEKNNILYHIDEHADSRDPEIELEKTDIKSIFEYTNFSKINVGNYIVPAEKQGLIGKTIQIRNTLNLEDYLNSPIIPFVKGDEESNIILNLDLDFFQPDLDFIDYELKKKVVLDIAKKASIITVSTSPFFIDQKLAIKVFKDLFGK